MGALIWYLVIGAAGGIFPPSRLGPMTQMECTAILDEAHRVAPSLEGRCRKVIGMYACEVPGRPGVGTSCPILDGEINPVTGKAE